MGTLKWPVIVAPWLWIAWTFAFPTSSLKRVYGIVTGAFGLGRRNRESRKLASKINRNQSQVFRGGIFAGGGPFGDPGRVGVVSVLPGDCCPIGLIVASCSGRVRRTS
jgi:hypothetical protein